MELHYTSHNFPLYRGPNFQGQNILNFTIQELFWSAITVGRANFTDVLRNGIYSQYEIMYRASLLVANLSLNGQRLVKSSAYEHLDPSEKSAVSYFLGLTFTKLLSAKLLNMPWVMHVDVYRRQFEIGGNAINFRSSRSRPDLIGLDSGRNWIVLESKGRTNGVNLDLLDVAKEQTRKIRRIGGAYPTLRVGVVTHFPYGEVFVDWIDPEGHSEDSFDLKTTQEEYLSKYYNLIYNILSQNSKDLRSRNGYITYTFDGTYLTIGLDESIYLAYESQRLSQIEPKFFSNSYQPLFDSELDFYGGTDGILIGLGRNWRDLIQSNKKFNE